MYDNFYAPFYQSLDAVFVEPNGFQVEVKKSVVSHKSKVKPIDGDSITVKLNKPRKELTCNEIAGISSAVFASSLGPSVPQFFYNTVMFPKYQYFSNGVQRFVDGGSTDNTGILALLRRGCTKIVAGIACNSSIDAGDPSDVDKSSYGHIAGLFGVQKSEFCKVSKQQYNEQRKVFDSSKWDELLTALKKKRAAGDKAILLYQ